MINFGLDKLRELENEEYREIHSEYSKRQECRQEIVKNNMNEQLCPKKDRLRGSHHWSWGGPEGQNKGDVRDTTWEERMTENL